MIELRGRTEGRITVLAEQSLAHPLEDAFSASFGQDAKRFLWLPAAAMVAG